MRRPVATRTEYKIVGIHYQAMTGEDLACAVVRSEVCDLVKVLIITCSYCLKRSINPIINPLPKLVTNQSQYTISQDHYITSKHRFYKKPEACNEWSETRTHNYDFHFPPFTPNKQSCDLVFPLTNKVCL